MTANNYIHSTASRQVVFVTMTTKGGAGKTETADVLEAALTLSGRVCRLIDVDDGNSGLARRVGKSEVVKADWSNGVAQAPAWVERYSRDVDGLVFDLGAGIESADLPIMAFLSTTWRLLQDRGARIIFCAVASTNAATPMFIKRIAENYGTLGEIVIVFNNQDGSAAFSDEVAARPEPKLHLGQLPAGIQAVRLAHQARLSNVIRSPVPGFDMATRRMAARLIAFAGQPVIRDAVGPDGLEKLRALSGGGVPSVHFRIRHKDLASDEMILQNARVAAAHALLMAPDPDDAAILSAARQYRDEQKAWHLLQRERG